MVINEVWSITKTWVKTLKKVRYVGFLVSFHEILYFCQWSVYHISWRQSPFRWIFVLRNKACRLKISSDARTGNGTLQSLLDFKLKVSVRSMITRWKNDASEATRFTNVSTFEQFWSLRDKIPWCTISRPGIFCSVTIIAYIAAIRFNIMSSSDQVYQQNNRKSSETFRYDSCSIQA